MQQDQETDVWGSPDTEEAGLSEGDNKPRRVCSRWSTAEHAKLVELVNKFGPRRWPEIASFLPGRKGKQCRERWLNHAAKDRPRKGHWTPQEEFTLASLHSTFSTQWRRMVDAIPGRTDNDIKNHFYATMRCKMEDNSMSLLWLYVRELKASVAPQIALITALKTWEAHINAEQVEQVLGYLPSQRPELLPKSLVTPVQTLLPSGGVMPNGTPLPGVNLPSLAQLNAQVEEDRAKGEDQTGDEPAGKRLRVGEDGTAADQGAAGTSSASLGPGLLAPAPVARKSGHINLLAAAVQSHGIRHPRHSYQRAAPLSQPKLSKGADASGEQVSGGHQQEQPGGRPLGVKASSSLSTHSHKSQGSDTAQRNAARADPNAQTALLADMIKLAQVAGVPQPKVEVPVPPPMFLRNQHEARRRQQQPQAGSAATGAKAMSMQPIMFQDLLAGAQGVLPGSWLPTTAGGDLVTLPSAFAAGQLSDGLQDSHGSGGQRLSPMPQQPGGPSLMMVPSVTPDNMAMTQPVQLPVQQGCFVDPRLSVDGPASHASHGLRLVTDQAGMARVVMMQQEQPQQQQQVAVGPADVNPGTTGGEGQQEGVVESGGTPGVGMVPAGEVTSLAVPPSQWAMQPANTIVQPGNNMAAMSMGNAPVLIMQPDGQLVQMWGAAEQRPVPMQMQPTPAPASFAMHHPGMPQIMSIPSTLNDGGQGMMLAPMATPMMMQPVTNTAQDGSEPNISSMASVEACNQVGQYIITPTGQMQLTPAQAYPAPQLMQLPTGQIVQTMPMMQHVPVMKTMMTPAGQRLVMCQPAPYAAQPAPVGYLPVYAEDMQGMGMMQVMPQSS